MRFEVVNIVLGVLIGSMVGLGIYTFVYAKGYSYLSNDPRGRANCHVMQDNYSAWLTSSHHTVATCNDCDAPHADQYSVTEFAQAINTCRQGQLAPRRDVKSVSVQFPSIPNTQLGQPSQNEK
jgi:nitrate/TMAO reductase-like tetraheme cytochrome c subunit